jgi:uncharacterized protein
MRALLHARFGLFSLLGAALLALLPAAARAERVQDLPQPTDYVSDYAHVLSPQAIARLDAVCEQLDHSQANAKVAVVTVHDLDGDDAADYANQLEDHWKMGDKGQNRYALVLLAVADHKYRIEVGYGLEGILPDGKTGDIGRAMVPSLRAQDYDGAMTLAVSEIAQTIATDANVTLNDVQLNQEEPIDAIRPVHHSVVIGKLILLLIVLVLFGGGSLLRMLFGFGLFFGGWGRGGWRGGPWIGGGGGFGGGGFGDGGGGGGGFSGFGGAGGGFGGGGAGGSW